MKLEEEREKWRNADNRTHTTAHTAYTQYTLYTNGTHTHTDGKREMGEGDRNN